MALWLAILGLGMLIGGAIVIIVAFLNRDKLIEIITSFYNEKLKNREKVYHPVNLKAEIKNRKKNGDYIEVDVGLRSFLGQDNIKIKAEEVSDEIREGEIITISLN